MRKGLNYLLVMLSVLLVVESCTKNTPYSAPSSNFPVGNFIGPFTLIHKNPVTNKLDTSSALVTLAMTSNVTYAIGGDTTKIQASSYGSFDVNNITQILTFYDATVTKTTNLNAPKKHLNGPFLYTFDGQNLHIYGSSDTLSYNYALQSY